MQGLNLEIVIVSVIFKDLKSYFEWITFEKKAS